MLKYAGGILLCGLLALLVQAQETVVNELSCQGFYLGDRAVVKGQRFHESYNALGDGYVQFKGFLSVENRGTARMLYEGYTVAYKGLLLTPEERILIAVIDATGDNGDEMIIYDDRESLGPPDILGQFVCEWR